MTTHRTRPFWSTRANLFRLAVLLTYPAVASAQSALRTRMDSALFRAVVVAVRDTVKEGLRIDPLLLRADSGVDEVSTETRISDSPQAVAARRDLLDAMLIPEGDALKSVACAGFMLPYAPLGEHRECPSQPYSVVAMGGPRHEQNEAVDRAAGEIERIKVRVLVYRYGSRGSAMISYDYVLVRTTRGWIVKRRIALIFHE